MNIILIAPQAAGKGTQAALIRDKYHIPHISMGDLLRAVRNEDTDLARTVIKCQDSGILVPQEIVSEVLAERLKKEDCLNGYILDGYPRNMEQAKLLAESGSKIDYVIYLNVKKDEVLKRITGRNDDNILEIDGKEIAIYADSELNVRKEGTEYGELSHIKYFHFYINQLMVQYPCSRYLISF